jgi:hypothetical protein
VTQSRNAICSALAIVLSISAHAIAATTVFFDPSQLAMLVSSGVTSDTISSRGYLFTYTRDKLFTGGTGQVIGRPVRVSWPDGVEAQAVTTPPPGVTDYKARITISRVDGKVFDLTAFTFKLLANTAGAGGTLEIMPVVNGEDAFPDPLYFDATGITGMTFSYDTSPNYLGSTALLTGYDTYKVGLYVDFVFVALTLDTAAVPGDFDGDLDVDQIDMDAFMLCDLGPAIPVTGGCASKDLDFDGDVDAADFGIFQRCYSGVDPGDPNCAS